jgi:hypothetical protein
MDSLLEKANAAAKKAAEEEKAELEKRQVQRVMQRIIADKKLSAASDEEKAWLENKQCQQAMMLLIADKKLAEEEAELEKKELKRQKGKKAETFSRPILMTPAERRKLVYELVSKIEKGDEDGATASQKLLRMIESESSTIVGIEIAVMVVAELIHGVINGCTTVIESWLVKNPNGVRVLEKPAEKCAILGSFLRNQLIKATAVQGDYLVVPAQGDPSNPGYGVAKSGYVKILYRDGRKNVERLTDLRDKMPILELLMSLTQMRHACVELAKIPRLIKTLTAWATQVGLESDQLKAWTLLQRLRTASTLLRSAGDGGQIQTMRRCVCVCVCVCVCL